MSNIPIDRWQTSKANRHIVQPTGRPTFSPATRNFTPIKNSFNFALRTPTTTANPKCELKEIKKRNSNASTNTT